jgi:hypothetical protein
MQAIKRILLFYVISIVVLIMLIAVMGGNVYKTIGFLYFWILPLIFSFVAWLLGAGAYELAMRPAEKKNIFFLIPHILAIGGLATIVIVNRLSADNWRTNINSKENHSIMKFHVHDNEPYIRTAFNELEAKFDTPNDFSLDAFSVNKRDTIIDNNIDTIYTVTFAYYLKNDPRTQYFSKVAIVKNIPTVLEHIVNTRTNAEYQRKEEEKQKMVNEILSDPDLKKLTDSLTKELKSQ